MKKRRLKRSFALLAAASLVVAACGGDDDDSAEEPADEPATEEPADDDGDGGEPADDDGDGDGDEPAEDVIESGETAEEEVDTEVEEVTETAQYGGELVVGIEAELNGMRPWEDNCSTNCYSVLNTIYDKLFETTKDGEVVGYLADTMTANDTLDVWVMTLREGITFHDGSDLTAQTIADMFPIQQAGATAAGQVAASGLLSVEATGPLEVTYTLGAPNVAFPSFLERTTLGHVFQPEAAADADAFNANPIGTGPFMLESRDLDNATRVVRNENYWRTDADGNQLPYLDAVEFRIIPDEGARLDSLTSGTVNAIITLRQNTIRDARNNSDGLTLIEAQGNNTGGGFFNAGVAPFDDVRVRRGLSYMVNQEAGIEALGGTGISLPGSQQFSPDSPWYSETAAAAYLTFDFDAGTAELQSYIDDPERSDGKAAGEPIDVELSCPPDPTLIALMQTIQQPWEGSGLVNVEVTQFDQPTHIDKAFNAQHGAHCWRMGSDSDPALWVPSFIGPPNEEIAAEFGYDAPQPLNFADWFDNDTYQAALAASATTDFDERYALYEQVFTTLNEQAVYWYSGHTALMIATSDDVVGVNGWTLPDGQLGIGILPEANLRAQQVFINS